ncbi:MAG: SbmA/BacA-like family transporter, partial [Cucumibacter sp.]
YLFCVPWYFFGGNRRWFWWSVVGSVTIIEVVYFNVQVSAWLNDWYGTFYNLIQTALTTPNSVTLDQFLGEILTVAYVLIPNITVLVLNAFFIAHYLFRWRRAMSFYYMSHWSHLRQIEGASQRVQEDTQRFANIFEGLAVSLVASIMTLIVFLPLLWELSTHIVELPFFGAIQGSLVWVALVSSAFGTVLLAAVGFRLPGLEFHNQRVEAAYRKELVYGEDSDDRGQPVPVRELFINMQKNYFRLYRNYLYFNVARYAYLQGSNFVPLIAMGPAIVTGAITLGLFQQIANAFGQVEDSFKFLASSWTSIIALIAVYRRLRAFEANIPSGAVAANDYDDPRFLNSGVMDIPPAPESAPAQ